MENRKIIIIYFINYSNFGTTYLSFRFYKCVKSLLGFKVIKKNSVVRSNITLEN